MIDAADNHALEMDSKGRVRRPFSAMRLVGNLLIVSGLLMLVGIGGWYGWNWYSNEQFLSRGDIRIDDGQASNAPAIVTSTTVSGLSVTPTLPALAVQPTVPPPANLNTQPGIGTWVGVTKPEQDISPPVKLVIGSVGIDAKVVPIGWSMIPGKGGARSEWNVADYAVGHHAGSANPGQVGNVVMSGHVDYKGEVFKNLHNVKKGDEVVVYTEKGQYLYVVTDLVLVKEDGVPEEVKRANARYMDPTPDQTLTMITCWPYGIDDHRFIAIAKPYQAEVSTQSEFLIR